MWIGEVGTNTGARAANDLRVDGAAPVLAPAPGARTGCWWQLSAEAVHGHRADAPTR